MAVSDFVPLVGSGFDSLANQRLQWENFNRGIEEANIARATQAEQRQDSWLAQVAQMNEQRDEQNFQRQMDADAYVRQKTATDQAEATRQRERAQDIATAQKQSAAQLAYGKNYLDTQQKIAEDKIAASEKNKDLILDSQGQHLAANYLGLQNTQKQTAQALDDLHSQIDDVATQLEQERAKKKPDQVKIMGLQSRQKLYNQSLRQREADARKAENDLERLKNRAENAKFEINDDGTITHPESNKTWTWKNAMKQAAAAIQPPPTDTTETADNYNPLTAGLATTPAMTPLAPPPPSGTNSFSVGRFTVTPQ